MTTVKSALEAPKILIPNGLVAVIIRKTKPVALTNTAALEQNQRELYLTSTTKI